MPEVTYYKPSGIPVAFLKEVRLSIEEMEAFRLKDGEMLDQEESAGRMAVSRATFQRILKRARNKVAQALTQGQAIRIEGGVFELCRYQLECKKGHRWEISSTIKNENQECPTCGLHGIRVE